MVGFNVMDVALIAGLSLIVLLGFMAYQGSGLPRYIAIAGIIVVGTTLLTGIWYAEKGRQATQNCVATVMAEEGWEKMPSAELYFTAQRAVYDQPVTPNKPELVAKYCASVLHDAQNIATLED